MPDTKKITQGDVTKLFEKTKKKLHELGKETSAWIKKGEVELNRISKIGRLELDIFNLNMEKEKLFKDIGKRMVEKKIFEDIDDPGVKDISNKAKNIISECGKKKSEISKLRKSLLKGG